MAALVDEVNAPSAAYRGRLLLIASWTNQCLQALLRSSDDLATTVRRAIRKNVVDRELGAALTALASIAERAGQRHRSHHSLLVPEGADAPVARLRELQDGYDELEQLTNDYQFVFQFALALHLHVTGPADHPDEVALPIRLLWRP